MKNEAILDEARERLKLAISAELDNRERAMDDLRNLAGFQWPEGAREAREADGRPCVTINRLTQFLRQVTGDIRNMNPSIDIRPADTKSSKETAELYEGLIRDIQYRSNATEIYEGAGELAAACGMGFFRVLTEYEDELSFNQTIRIARIDNSFSVYCDPEARTPTREDAGWWLITETMTEDEFKRQYPGKSAANVEADGATDNIEAWRKGTDVLIAEYYWLEYRDARLVMLEDGTVLQDPVGPISGVIQERKTKIPKVMWAKISGTDILDGPKEFPGRHLPVIAVMGEEIHIGDEVYRSSVIRHAKEPQRIYNYWRSAQTEQVALQPKAPFLVTPAQIKGHERYWARANVANTPFLPYNPDKDAPSPQRVSPPIASSGMMQEILGAADDMKATTGIYDASLGQRSNEQSGVAIRQRQMESDVSTSIYSDNVKRAVARCGRIIVDMIPVVYDTQRTIRAVDGEGGEEMVTINRPMQSVDGGMIENDMTSGRYDVRVSVGPNYSTKRQEAAESMVSFAQAFPAFAQVAGDLVAKNMDWPGAEEIAKRLEHLLPPELRPDRDGEGQPQGGMDPQMQQMQQMAAQIAQELEVLRLRQEEAKARKAEADAEKAEIGLNAEAQGLIAAQAAQLGLMPGY